MELENFFLDDVDEDALDWFEFWNFEFEQEVPDDWVSVEYSPEC